MAGIESIYPFYKIYFNLFHYRFKEIENEVEIVIEWKPVCPSNVQLNIQNVVYKKFKKFEMNN